MYSPLIHPFPVNIIRKQKRSMFLYIISLRIRLNNSSICINTKIVEGASASVVNLKVLKQRLSHTRLILLYN